MKKLILLAAAIGLLGLIAYWFTRPGPGVETLATSEAIAVASAETPNDTAANLPPQPFPSAHPVQPASHTDQTRPVAPDDSVFRQTIAWIISPQTSFEQKQAEWRKLRESGRLGDAIKELEEQAAAHPADANYPAALGQAYIYQITNLKDVREQGMLGMKADVTFDTALQLDPQNWEARFFKATAMSYWPGELKKGPEVIEQFRQLIDQQEAMAPQPHFAQSYAWLGEQYKKAGQADYAKQVWERGAALFPGDAALKQKLAPSPAGN